MATLGNRIDFRAVRRPALAAVVALALGVLLGPMGLRLLRPQLLEDGARIETISEIVLLICLFCVGLRLRMPIDWRSWHLPLRLATLTTLATFALTTAAAHLIFDMNLAAALLLAAIVTPTDSVLACECVHPDPEHESLTLSLAAESGVNGGISTVLVLAVLGMMGLAEAGTTTLSSIGLAAAWAVAGGFAAGWVIGAGMARGILLIDPERQAEFLEEVSIFAAAALAYGAALAIHTNGFLAVLAAGVALAHGGRFRRPLRNKALMPRLLRVANRIERYCWLAIIVLLGTLIASVEFHARMLVFAIVLMLLVRPLAVRLGLGGLAIPDMQWRGIAWFTARGVATLYGLSLAINHGLEPVLARQLAGITVVVLVSSILASAASGLPLSRSSPGTVAF